jgi:uridine phosphorylase
MRTAGLRRCSVAFPGYAGKHGGVPYVTPTDWIEWNRERGMLDDVYCPEAVVITFQHATYRSLVDVPDAQLCGGRVLRHLVALERTGRRVGVIGGFGIGAPAAAVVLEELIALGANRFISVGSAGALQPDSAIAEIVVATGAVRDDGVSHHYLPADVAAEPDAALTAALIAKVAALGGHRSGLTWTIDAPYQETAAEVAHYRAAGVATVEMEAAALFAVASVRGVALASAFCVSDLLASPRWQPRFDSPELAASLVALGEAAVDVLCEGPP